MATINATGLTKLATATNTIPAGVAAKYAPLSKTNRSFYLPENFQLSLCSWLGGTSKENLGV